MFCCCESSCFWFDRVIFLVQWGACCVVLLMQELSLFCCYIFQTLKQNTEVRDGSEGSAKREISTQTPLPQTVKNLFCQKDQIFTKLQEISLVYLLIMYQFQWISKLICKVFKVLETIRTYNVGFLLFLKVCW